MAGGVNASLENITFLCRDVTATCGNQTSLEGNISTLCQNLTSFCATVSNPPLTAGGILFAALISLGLIFAFIVLIHKCIRLLDPKMGFLDIFRDERWFPSLALTQFLIWTVIISFSYILVSILRIHEGIIAYPENFPINLLLLMGISIAVPVASGKMSPLIYGKKNKAKPEPDKLEPFWKMLLEDGKPTLAKLQMSLWTLIGVLVYLFILGSTLRLAMTDITKLTIPDIDITLVFLMGLSQGAYLGGKLVLMSTTDAEVSKPAEPVQGDQPSAVITVIQPDYGKPGDTISIYGKGFGNSKEAVWFDAIKITGADITDWSEKSITLKIPVSLQVQKNGPIDVKVSNREGLSEAKQFVLY
jgi:hypothetical protein